MARVKGYYSSTSNLFLTMYWCAQFGPERQVIGVRCCLRCSGDGNVSGWQPILQSETWKLFAFQTMRAVNPARPQQRDVSQRRGYSSGSLINSGTYGLIEIVEPGKCPRKLILCHREVVSYLSRLRRERLGALSYKGRSCDIIVMVTSTQRCYVVGELDRAPQNQDFSG